MRDGIRLCIDIYRPPAAGKYPVLLSLSPYAKDFQQHPPQWSHAIESGATAFYVGNGYIHVIAQGRGAGRSQGKWELFGPAERTDGYDLIEWIAAQDWCDGNIGMIGDSYWSWSQYHAAIAQPPHLKCICQCDATTDLYRDLAYQGGIYNHQFLSQWVPYHSAMMAWPGDVEGKQEPMNLSYQAVRHPCDDDFWQQRSARRGLGDIEVPVMSICPQGGHMHFRGQLAGWPKIASRNKKLYVVPPTGFWSHLRYLTDRALNTQMLRWFDHWLKGIDTGLMDEPDIAIFDSGTRSWRYEGEYPLARTQWSKFYLRAGETPEDLPRGKLDATPPGDETPHRYAMPESYARLTKGEPVLAFTSAALDAPLRVWGPLSLTLHVASTQVDTAFFVKVFDISAGGGKRLVSRGLLRASFSEVDAARSAPGQPFHPFTRQELLEPGCKVECQIELVPMFHTFAAGHRLQLEIASEDLQYSNPLRTLDVPLLPWPVENTIFHDSASPSHLLLPVIPDAPELEPVGEPLASVDWPAPPGNWLPHTAGWPLKP